MEMEHINKNTIRVLIDNDDLSARGITILDLLGDHQQIEDFFYSILREVDTDHQFQDNDSVTFQVMPTNDGLELFISKSDPNLSAEDRRANSEQIAQYIKKRMGQAKKVNQATPHAATPANQEQEPEISHHANSWKVVAFSSFENLIDYARIVEDDDEVVSELYKYNHRYYLALQYFQPVDNDAAIKDSLALAYEYGDPTAVTTMFLSEHGKKLMAVSALHTIRHYFN